MKSFDIKINGYVFRMKFENILHYINQLNYMSTYLGKERLDVTSLEIASDIDIVYIEDVSLYQSLCSKIKISDNRNMIDTFEYQKHEWSTIDNKEVFLNEKEQYLVLKKSESTFIFITSNPDKNLAYPLYITYEILVRLEENKKALFMHGTSLKYDGIGTLLLNNKAMGKTTFLVKLLEEKKLSKEFLSNDRTFIFESNEGYEMSSFPIPVIVSGGTIKNSEPLREYMQITKTFKRDISQLDDHKSSCGIGNDVFSRIFPLTTSTEKSQLNRILIPNIKLGATGIFDIYENQDHNILHDTCFTPYDTESLRKAWLYARKYSDNELLEMSHQLLERIRNDIPIYTVDYSPDLSSQAAHQGINKVLGRKT